MTWATVATTAVSAVGSAVAANNRPKTSSSSSEVMPTWYSDQAKAAGSRANDIMNRGYSQYLGPRVAGLGANEQGALSAAGSLGDKTQPFMSRLQQGFTPGALSQFTNPYTDSVLGARTRSIGEEYGRQSANLGRDQAATDAFRSGRSDLARSRLDSNRIRALDEATNQTKSDAYDKGMSSYFNQNASDVGALNATTNSELGRIGALSSTGANERGIRQGQNDFNYGQFLERRDWDVNNLGPMLQFLQASKPSGGTTTGRTTNSSGAGGYLGAAAALAGQFLQNRGNGLSNADNAGITKTVNDPSYVPTAPAFEPIGG